MNIAGYLLIGGFALLIFVGVDFVANWLDRFFFYVMNRFDDPD